MKKRISCFLSVVLGLSLILSFATGCALHKHVFDKIVFAPEYLVSTFNCKEEANYYYSCECGEKGEQIFKHSDVNEHEFVENKYCVCGLLNSEYYTEGLSFALINNQTEYSVSGYNGNEEEIIIPKTYNNKPVTRVADKTFYELAQIKNVIMGNNVTTIDGDAFMGCLLLEKVEISTSLQSIGYQAFKGCEKLEKIEIPYGVNNIGEGAFFGCSSITSIKIPSSLDKLNDWAFSNCSSLANLEIENGIESIGFETFAYCSSLNSVIIPNSVTTIGTSAFARCSSMNRLVIGNGVTSIGIYAFSSCTSLTSVVIPVGVAIISARAFNNTETLQTIYCQASEKPSGWSDDWNKTSAEVVWGYNSEN